LSREKRNSSDLYESYSVVKFDSTLMGRQGWSKPYFRINASRGFIVLKRARIQTMKYH